MKMEGGREILDDIKAIINAGIPVMGHLGYTPQSVNLFGGHKAQGKTSGTAVKILEDALMLQKAGVFSIVFECVPHKLARLVSSRLDIPVIGIGSGSGCDGQVLVTPDMIGLFRDFTPRHAKKFADMGSAIEQASRDYIAQVRDQVFPTPDNSYKISDEILEEANEAFGRISDKI